MKRALGLSSTSHKLRAVGLAAARSAWIDTPSKRAESSGRFACAIRSRIVSAMARLDETRQYPACATALDRFAGPIGSIAQTVGEPRGHQQCRSIENDDIVLGAWSTAAEQCFQPLGVLARVASLNRLERSALDPGVLRHNLKLLNRSVRQA